MKRLSLTIAILLCALASFAQVTLTVSPSQRGAEIGKLHYGIFFEEINHAGDGGLYAELIRNRSFEDNDESPVYWSVMDGDMSLVSDILLNPAQRHSLIWETEAGGMLMNDGFWGMKFVSGETYSFSAFMLTDVSGSFTVSLLDENGDAIGSASIDVPASEEWQKVTATITATGNASRGSFALQSLQDGQYVLDMVSLFPPTFKGRANGCRPDLAQMLADMKPSFMRFPGGCYVEGDYRNYYPHYDMEKEEWSYGSTNRFEWKQTIGPVEQRPGHWNVSWNYRVSDGLGFHEMLQLSEDLGAAPLFVVNVGMGHGWTDNLSNIDYYVQEALDALEYANGDASTTYGAMRIANGHPEPFNLKLIEIGNENWQANYREQSYDYAERYYAIYKRIKEKYPDVMCIGNVEAWGTDNPTWRTSYPTDAVDEHYYRSPEWFVKAYAKYDSYDRSKMQKVYAGEYAVTSNFGTTGNLAAALGEAVYMQGMENNSDICVMSSYAPIFTHESDFNWKPDMIRFNSAESYGTPSYYVQKLMPNYVGKQNVEWMEEGNVTSQENKVGLSTWQTSARFSNFRVTLADGTVYEAPFDGTESWSSQGGNWSESNGTLTQASTSMEGKLYFNPSLLTGDNYTIEVDAVKTGGKEGFLIAFNMQDSNNYLWWNLGGWGNTKHAVEMCVNGVKTNMAESSGYLQNDITYNIRIEVRNTTVKCYLNEQLVHSFSIPASRKVYVASSIDDETGKLYLKLVNPNGAASNTVIRLKDYKTTGGKLIQMKSASDRDENTNDSHYTVVPQEEELGISGSQFTFNVPAYSLNILELNVEEGESEDGVFIESGNYYIGNADSGLYLSRGADWGTRATFDRLGMPIAVTRAANGTYTLRYLDSSSYLGKDVQPYTDKSMSYPVSWNFQTNPAGQLVLCNTGSGEFLMAGEGSEAGASFTTDITLATPVELISIASHDAAISRYRTATDDVADCVSTDVTEMTIGIENIGASLEGCATAFSKATATSYGVTEIYEGFGKFTRTVTGLKPDRLYRLTIPAFLRSTTTNRLVQLQNDGIQVSNAYLFCGDNIIQVMPWAKDRTGDNAPNSMKEVSQCFADGLYRNVIVGTTDSQGTLSFGICLPQRNPGQWLIWGDATMELVETPEDCTAYITNPSFESGLTGWITNMQTQGNNEPSAMKQGTLYCEMWTKEPGHLWDVYAMQTVDNLPVGKYRLTAACHAENQSGTPKVASGAYLFAADQRVSVSKPQDYSIIVSVTDGTLDMGFLTEGTDANWVTVDNFRLTYLGNDADETTQIEAYAAMLEKEMQKLQSLLDVKTILTPELRNEGNATLTLAGNAATLDEMKDAVDAVKECYAKLDAYRIDIKRNDPYTSYIFTYFPSNSDENLYIAHSMNGFDFTPLNDGHRVMASDTVAIKKGIRDPHILRGIDGKTFYMVATDMRCAEGWDSNRGMVLYKSTDLVHWQHATVHFPTRFPEKWKNVTRVWAPEVIWNPDYQNANGTKGRYMIYFSLLTNDGTCRYDKVFYCHANDDFTDLIEEPIFLYDRGSATIDADIVYDECDQLYHMIYKNEGSGGICHVTARTLTAPEGAEPGSQWGKPSGTIQQTNEAVEGGGLFRLINSNSWVVMYDCYANGHYQFCTTDDWKTYTYKQDTYTYGAFTPRHGTVMPVTTAEAKRLLKAFPTRGYNPALPASAKGDVNEDGYVNMEDANLILNHVRGNRSASLVEQLADIDGDGTVSINDANEVVNIYLGE